MIHHLSNARRFVLYVEHIPALPKEYKNAPAPTIVDERGNRESSDWRLTFVRNLNQMLFSCSLDLLEIHTPKRGGLLAGVELAIVGCPGLLHDLLGERWPEARAQLIISFG